MKSYSFCHESKSIRLESICLLPDNTYFQGDLFDFGLGDKIFALKTIISSQESKHFWAEMNDLRIEMKSF